VNSTERIADDLQQPLLCELLDEQSVLREETGVVDADAGGDEAPEVAPDRRVEAEPGERLTYPLLVDLVQRVERHVVLSRVGRVLLGEVDEVDRGTPGLEQLVHAGVQGRPPELEVERHGSLDRLDHGRLAAGPCGEVAPEEVDVAERRGHQDELGLRQLEQRYLPGPAALWVAVEVELVDDGQVDRRPPSLAKRPVGEDLLGAADDRRLRVDRCVAGHHADHLGAELPRQREELLADERLDRGRVDAALARREGGEVRCRSHHRLAGAGRRVEDDVVAEHDLEDRLLLRRVELQSETRDVLGEPVDHGVGLVGPGQVSDDRRGHPAEGRARTRAPAQGSADPRAEDAVRLPRWSRPRRS
jgi:hypothetical protein